MTDRRAVPGPIRGFARRHPVLSYYGLVFTISWGGILMLVGRGGIPGEPDDVARLFPFVLAALFAGPSVSGVVMIALVSGRVGLGAARERLSLARGRSVVGGSAPDRAGAGRRGAVRAVALLGRLRPRPAHRGGQARFAQLRARVGLVGGGLLEELGWTGFAVPTLRRRYTALTTGLIVGLLWGTWHVLIAGWASRGLGRRRRGREGSRGEVGPFNRPSGTSHDRHARPRHRLYVGHGGMVRRLAARTNEALGIGRELI